MKMCWLRLLDFKIRFTRINPKHHLLQFLIYISTSKYKITPSWLERIHKKVKRYHKPYCHAIIVVCAQKATRPVILKMTKEWRWGYVRDRYQLYRLIFRVLQKHVNKIINRHRQEYGEIYGVYLITTAIEILIMQKLAEELKKVLDPDEFEDQFNSKVRELWGTLGYRNSFQFIHDLHNYGYHIRRLLVPYIVYKKMKKEREEPPEPYEKQTITITSDKELHEILKRLNPENVR